MAEAALNLFTPTYGTLQENVTSFLGPNPTTRYVIEPSTPPPKWLDLQRNMPLSPASIVCGGGRSSSFMNWPWIRVGHSGSVLSSSLVWFRITTRSSREAMVLRVFKV